MLVHFRFRIAEFLLLVYCSKAYEWIEFFYLVLLWDKRFGGIAEVQPL